MFIFFYNTLFLYESESHFTCLLWVTYWWVKESNTLSIKGRQWLFRQFSTIFSVYIPYASLSSDIEREEKKKCTLYFFCTNSVLHQKTISSIYPAVALHLVINDALSIEQFMTTINCYSNQSDTTNTLYITISKTYSLIRLKLH